MPTAAETSVTPPPRRRLARADRARVVLEAAEEIFAERGLARASMAEIAARAGVTKPVLYDHFGSKDGLLAEVIRRAGEELRAALQTAVAAADSPADALARGLRTYFEFIEKHALSWTTLLTEGGGSPAGTEALESVRREQAAYIAALIAEQLLPERRDAAAIYAQAVIGACERLAMLRAAHVDPAELDAETVAARLMDLFWLGFSDLRTGLHWSPEALALR
ncbi:MAG: TetR/AcrR family transcriptional regulator [Actinomycetes bacterium]